jgi:hypothetical protein
MPLGGIDRGQFQEWIDRYVIEQGHEPPASTILEYLENQLAPGVSPITPAPGVADPKRSRPTIAPPKLEP